MLFTKFLNSSFQKEKKKKKKKTRLADELLLNLVEFCAQNVRHERLVLESIA